MAYKRTTWKTGDTITAAKLNNIEKGILSVEATANAAGNVSSTTITAIEVMDRADYEKLTTRPSTTVYIVKG